MAHAQEGDRDAYRALLEDIRPLILGWLRRWLGDDADLADVYQDTLVHLHRARHTYEPARPFEPWLFALARHCAADHGRLRKRRMREVLVEDVPEVPIDGDQERPALADALSALPRQQREAFTMLKLEGLSVGAAAARAGTTPGALKVRAHRAYKALKEFLRGRE
jgi:RNA polymerase sigma factor (sigma-70 family)